jgi:DNA-binding transcriptional regulator PaaX
MKNQYTEIAERLLKENNITVRQYRKSMSGRAFIKEREIIIPRPTGKISLLICLHEIAHIVNGEIKPRYKEEYLAEKWAMDKCRELGIRVPRSYTRRAKRYISFKVHQAKKRGLKKIRSQSVYHFIK